MGRSASESSCCVTPFCGMQVPFDAPVKQSRLKELTAIRIGAQLAALVVQVALPLSVERLGSAQSAWNFQTCRVPPPSNDIIGFGAPAGGGSAPSGSAGRGPPWSG